MSTKAKFLTKLSRKIVMRDNFDSKELLRSRGVPLCSVVIKKYAALKSGTTSQADSATARIHGADGVIREKRV